MAHSRKRTPYSGDNKGPNKKKYASRKVRQVIKNWDYLPQGNQYKQIYESYDICDYGCRETWRQYWERTLAWWSKWGQYQDYPYPDREREYWNWYKYNKRK